MLDNYQLLGERNIWSVDLDTHPGGQTGLGLQDNRSGSSLRVDGVDSANYHEIRLVCRDLNHTNLLRLVCSYGKVAEVFTRSYSAFC